MRAKITYLDATTGWYRVVWRTFTIQKETGQRFEEFKAELLQRGFVKRADIRDPDSEETIMPGAIIKVRELKG